MNFLFSKLVNNYHDIYILFLTGNNLVEVLKKSGMKSGLTAVPVNKAPPWAPPRPAPPPRPLPRKLAPPLLILLFIIEFNYCKKSSALIILI
jgi:hypothetical protein